MKKFRAWYSQDKQMINWFTLTQTAWNTFRGNTPLSLLYEILVARKEDFDVMQYTELEDKNKIDIYEQDILKVELPLGGFWGNTKKEKIGIVRYEKEYGAYIVQWEYSKHQHHENLTCDIAFTSEVLGNVYENPELLEKYNLRV